MKKEKDSRVNKSYVSIKEYAILLLCLAAFNGFHMWIYQILYRSGIIEENPRFAINVLMLFVMVTAAIVVAVIGLFRERAFIRPIRKLSEAVRKIAAGDFSVRIAPRHRDGKKDFFDVMLDDFNTMAGELASIETLKNDFIANVSHEIKTPLSVIQTYTTALQNNSVSADERTEYVQTILDATEKLSSLVTNILKLSKLENQDIMGEAEPFDLSEQLRRCVLMFADKMENKNIQFEEDLDEVNVCYDPHLLEIVWNNLLSNAVKFTNPGGGIFLSLKIQDDSMQKLASKRSLQVTVSDTGRGMNEAVKKRIFDKFYQSDTSRTGEGNGLGLALVKRTIDLLGGTITVDSTPGQGSNFTVTLQGDRVYSAPAGNDLTNS